MYNILRTHTSRKSNLAILPRYSSELIGVTRKIDVVAVVIEVVIDEFVEE
jgi:hypothetical protein